MAICRHANSVSGHKNEALLSTVTSLINMSTLVLFLMMRISSPTWSPVHTQESLLIFWIHSLFSDYSLDYNQTALAPPKENKHTTQAQNFLLHVHYSLLPPSGLACSFFFHPFSCSGLEKLSLWMQTWPKMTQLLLKNMAIWLPIKSQDGCSRIKRFLIFESSVYDRSSRYQKCKSTG